MLAQSPLYVRQDGGYKGLALDGVDCGRGLTCRICGSRWCIDADAGSSSGGGGAPTNATYITQVHDGVLSAEQAMGDLGTGLVTNTTTTGVQSIYAGSSCGANTFAQSANASGALTCSAVSLANADTTGTLTEAKGGTGAGALTCSSGQALTSNGSAYSCTSTLTASDVVCGTTCVADAEIAAVSGSKVSGAVATATALASNPSDCSSGQYANAIAASGDLTCSQVAFSQVSGQASLTTQVSGVLPVANGGFPVPPTCGLDAGSALGWDGGAFLCADVVKPGTCSAGQFVSAVSATAAPTCATPAGPQWNTALDCDFTDAGSQSFFLDGGYLNGGYLNPYTICGASFYMQELQQQLATRTLDSNGLNVTPTTGGDNTPADHGAPRTLVYLSQVVPSFTYDTPVRATVYFSANITANYDFVCLGLLTVHTPTISYNTGLLSNPEVCRIHYDSSTYLSWSIYQGGAFPASPPAGNWITPDVLRITYPSGVGSSIQVDSIGTYSSGFPADSAFLNTYVSQPPSNTAGGFQSTSDGIKAYAVEMVAARATSGTALVAHFKRLKLEYFR